MPCNSPLEGEDNGSIKSHSNSDLRAGVSVSNLNCTFIGCYIWWNELQNSLANSLQNSFPYWSLQLHFSAINGQHLCVFLDQKFEHKFCTSEIEFWEREADASFSSPRQSTAVFCWPWSKPFYPGTKTPVHSTTPTVGGESLLRRLWYHRTRRFYSLYLWLQFLFSIFCRFLLL